MLLVYWRCAVLKALIFGMVLCSNAFENVCGMTTAKHVAIDWNDQEKEIYCECRDFYFRVKDDKLESGESVNDAHDYICSLQSYIEDLKYEGASLNDQLKRSKFETLIDLLKSLE